MRNYGHMHVVFSDGSVGWYDLGATGLFGGAFTIDRRLNAASMPDPQMQNG